jgi:glycosyltransferase involved in cell wall biosynthesis
MLIWCRLNRIRPFQPGSGKNIFVSVVIACRNEAEHIYQILQRISQQNYPPELFEVIIIDDNSTDDTFDKASDFIGLKNLIVKRNETRGKKRAISQGIDIASGNLILTTDGDCIMGPDWIGTITAFYVEKNPDLIICPVIIDTTPGFFSRFQELEFLGLQGVTAGTAAARMSTMCNGANLAFKKESYLKHSENLRYDLFSGDDIFLLHSIKKEKRSKILWLESFDSIVTAASAKTTMSYLSQRSRWISKGKAYTDKTTVTLAIVTFVTILTQASFLIAGIFIPEFLLLFLAVLVIKSVTDYLILNNTTTRYGKKHLMKWFLPSQLIYPFYVLAVILFSVIYSKKQFR